MTTYPSAAPTVVRSDSQARSGHHAARSGHHRIVFGLGILFIGTLVHTIGTITRGWIIFPGQQGNYGLFNSNFDNTGALISVRVFTISGIVLGVGALILTGVYLKLTLFLTRRKIATLILVTGIGAAGSSLIGALIFALEFYFFITTTDVNYSFALCIVGGVLLAVGSIVTFLGARQHTRAHIQLSRRQISHSRAARNASLQALPPYQDPGMSGLNVWHTPVYTEPPPAYNQLELSHLSMPKEQPSEIPADVMPPSYSEAVKWYPKT